MPDRSACRRESEEACATVIDSSAHSEDLDRPTSDRAAAANSPVPSPGATKGSTVHACTCRRCGPGKPMRRGMLQADTEIARGSRTDRLNDPVRVVLTSGPGRSKRGSKMGPSRTPRWASIGVFHSNRRTAVPGGNCGENVARDRECTQTKRPRREPRPFEVNGAATYSPTRSPGQYHRRWRA